MRGQDFTICDYCLSISANTIIFMRATNRYTIFGRRVDFEPNIMFPGGFSCSHMYIFCVKESNRGLMAYKFAVLGSFVLHTLS